MKKKLASVLVLVAFLGVGLLGVDAVANTDTQVELTAKTSLKYATNWQEFKALEELRLNDPERYVEVVSEKMSAPVSGALKKSAQEGQKGVSFKARQY